MGCCGQKAASRVIERQGKPIHRKRPCTCEKADCHLCKLYHTDKRYYRLWGGNIKTVKLAMHANGIGDALLGLIAVAGARAKDPTAEIVYLCKNHEWVSLFDGYDTLLPLMQVMRHRDSINLNDGYNVECQSRALVPRWKRYCVNAGNVQPTIPNLKDRNILLEQGERYRGVLALAPFSIYNNRNWSLEHWLTLERLLLMHGYRTVILHDNADAMVRFRGDKRHDRTPREVASILVNAAALVGVDSGMAHLASMIGTPTFVLSGPCDPKRVYYAPVTPIYGHTDCKGCFWQTPYNGKCDLACAALLSISPNEVFDMIDAMILKTRTEDRSLLDGSKLAVIRDAVLKTNDLAGELAEFGVYKGGTAKLIAYFGSARVHLFDTFEGIPDDDTIGEHKRGDFADTNAEDVRAFVGEKAVMHVGRFPETADDSLLFRFVHLDMDTYESTKAALDYLDTRMVKGGIIVLDDYGWHRCQGVQRAVHDKYGDKVARASEYQALLQF